MIGRMGEQESNGWDLSLREGADVTIFLHVSPSPWSSNSSAAYLLLETSNDGALTVLGTQTFLSSLKLGPDKEDFLCTDVLFIPLMIESSV